MSATSATSKVTNENGALAHVNFRVRSETLGHGEAVFLVEEGDASMQKVGSPNSCRMLQYWMYAET
jgi:hypothetical protein